MAHQHPLGGSGFLKGVQSGKAGAGAHASSAAYYASPAFAEYVAGTYTSPTGKAYLTLPDGSVQAFDVPLPPGYAPLTAPPGPSPFDLLPPPGGGQAIGQASPVPAPDPGSPPAPPASATPLTDLLASQLTSQPQPSPEDHLNAAAAEFPQIKRVGSKAHRRFNKALQKAGGHPHLAVHVARTPRRQPLRGQERAGAGRGPLRQAG